MSSAIAQNYHDNLPRGSMVRGTTGLANGLTLLSLNRALTAAGSARGTTATKAKTVNTLTFTVAGAFLSKNATDDFWTLSGTVVAAASWQKYLLLIDATGTASIQQGTQSTISAASVSWTSVTNSAGAVQLGHGPLITVLNTGVTIVAVLTIATDATHTFTPGTTALNAAGITATFADGIDASLIPIICNEQSAPVGTF